MRRLPTLYCLPGWIYDLTHLSISLGVEERLKSRWIRRVDLPTNALVIDWGSGTGLSAAKIVQRLQAGDRLVMVEASPALCKSALARVAPLAARRQVAIDLVSNLDKAGGGEVDLVVASYSLGMQDMSTCRTILGEFADLLRPNGRLLVIDMFSHRTQSNRPLALFHALTRLVSRHIFGVNFSTCLLELVHERFEVEALEKQPHIQSFACLGSKRLCPSEQGIAMATAHTESVI